MEKVSEQSADRFAVALLQNKGQVYLMMDDSAKPYTIAGWKTAAEAAMFFTKGYMQNHSRGYEASMSACIHHITFQPRVVDITLAEIKEKLMTPEDIAHPRVFRAGNVSGTYMVLPCNASTAKKVYEDAFEPCLIV